MGCEVVCERAKPAVLLPTVTAKVAGFSLVIYFLFGLRLTRRGAGRNAVSTRARATRPVDAYRACADDVGGGVSVCFRPVRTCPRPQQPEWRQQPATEHAAAVAIAGTRCPVWVASQSCSASWRRARTHDAATGARGHQLSPRHARHAGTARVVGHARRAFRAVYMSGSWTHGHGNETVATTKFQRTYRLQRARVS